MLQNFLWHPYAISMLTHLSIYFAQMNTLHIKYTTSLLRSVICWSLKTSVSLIDSLLLRHHAPFQDHKHYSIVLDYNSMNIFLNLKIYCLSKKLCSKWHKFLRLVFKWSDNRNEVEWSKTTKLELKFNVFLNIWWTCQNDSSLHDGKHECVVVNLLIANANNAT